eukprot:3265310-Amphidinium_carterae.1
MAGDCDATTVGVQRLCACRRQSFKRPIWLQSPGQHLIGNAASEQDQDTPASQTRLSKHLVARLSLRSGSNVSRFAPAPAPGLEQSAPFAKLSPSKLLILVVAAPHLRGTPGDVQGLQATLTSLSKASGYRASSVVVAHDDSDAATTQLCQQDFGVKRVK